MIILDEIFDQYPVIHDEIKLFIDNQCGGFYSTSALIYFFDLKGIHISIISNHDGSLYLSDINGIIFETAVTRQYIEDITILDCIDILNDIYEEGRRSSV